MTELALVTVEITVTDRDSQGFDLGGPKEQARAMATALGPAGGNARRRYLAHQHGFPTTGRGLATAQAALGYLTGIWRQPDEGIWEVRGPRQAVVTPIARSARCASLSIRSKPVSMEGTRMSDLLSPNQCRAGRALLDWMQAELASRAFLEHCTVSRFESGKPVHDITTHILRLTLEEGGIFFTETGVRCRRPDDPPPSDRCCRPSQKGSSRVSRAAPANREDAPDRRRLSQWRDLTEPYGRRGEPRAHPATPCLVREIDRRSRQSALEICEGSRFWARICLRRALPASIKVTVHSA
jgi:transcriptional regulator with XRE-family HTH domain